MDQPSTCLGEIQPQDVSPSDIPPVIDLTGKGEERSLGSTALDSLQLVRSSSWYPNTTDPGLQFSDSSSSDIAIQSRNQNQLDNTLSHTTVTLSYMSRSRVFYSNDCMFQHSPLHSKPPISKLSLHSRCASESHLRITDYSQEQVEKNKHLPTQKECLFPQVQAGHACRAGGCVTQLCLELNGDGFVKSSVLDVEKHCHLLKDGKSLENGEPDGRLLSEGQSAPESLTSATTEKDENRASEVPLFSEKQNCVIVSENTGAQNLCRDYRSPLEDPVSPSSTSLDGVEDVFVLPQASSSPSADNSHLETAKLGAYDALSTGISDNTTGLDSSENEQPSHRPEPDFTVSNFELDVSENHQNHVVPHVNGKDNTLENIVKQRRLPARVGRGARLEEIVMSINSDPLSNQKNGASHSTTFDSTLSSPKTNPGSPIHKGQSKPTLKQKESQMKKGRSGKVDSKSDPELSKTKASNCSVAWKRPLVGMAQKKPVLPLRTSTAQCRRRPPSQSGPQTAANRNSKGTPQLLSQSGVFTEVTVPSLSAPQPEIPKNQDKTKSREVSPPGKKKVARTPKRRRRKTKPSHPSSMFSPKEPEIKLKYVSYKEEKKDSKLDFFSPFIRVQRKASLPSLCSIINYPEEVKSQQNTQPHTQPHTNTCGFVSAVIPSTSCLHLGRPSIHSQHQRAFICCLCGQPANAMDLGDLHGPYYPEGIRPSSKTAASTSGLKEEEEDFSDSDSYSFGMKAGRRKSVAPHTAWSVRNQLKQNMENRRRAGGDTNSPAAKRTRLEAGSSDLQDWFSPPILPLEPCEYWLHEDCSIWSAGVFLVKGRVYGLEEAVKIAHETTLDVITGLRGGAGMFWYFRDGAKKGEVMCSGCQHSGATLGCVFKGCPNKYHYRCALESDCVLIEENFSMKCKKHKNKMLKAPLGSQWNRR